MSETNLAYVGKVVIGRKTYEAFEDEANDLINLFYKNTSLKDIECLGLQRADVDKAKGRNFTFKNSALLGKTCTTQ